jgi:hypothetical protein
MQLLGRRKVKERILERNNTPSECPCVGGFFFMTTMHKPGTLPISAYQHETQQIKEIDLGKIASNNTPVTSGHSHTLLLQRKSPYLLQAAHLSLIIPDSPVTCPLVILRCNQDIHTDDDLVEVDRFLENPADPLTFYREGASLVPVKILTVEVDIPCSKHHITLDDHIYSAFLLHLRDSAHGNTNDSDSEDSEPLVRTQRGRQVRLPTRYGDQYSGW